MIARSRFFVASLWAALAPTGVLVVCGIVVMLFPKLHRLGDLALIGSGLWLVGVPFAYTAVVVATYGIGRSLYGLHMLTRTTLLAVYGLLAVMGAWFTTWWISADETFDVLRSFALLLVLAFVAAGSTALLWWRAVSRVIPGAVEDDPHLRVRRRQRRSFFRRLASKW